MEPQQQPRSTPPPPPATPGAPKPPAPPGAAPGDAPAGAAISPAPDVAGEICPSCSAPRAEETRYCEECGHDYGGQTAPEAEERSRLSGPVLWVVMVFWLAIAVGGLWFLFSVLWAA